MSLRLTVGLLPTLCEEDLDDHWESSKRETALGTAGFESELGRCYARRSTNRGVYFARTMCVCRLRLLLLASLPSSSFLRWNFYLRFLARSDPVGLFFGEKVRAAKIFSVE